MDASTSIRDIGTGVDCTLLDRISASARSQLPLPRILLVTAHPDDEVIAVGARLERFRDSRMICVTDGSPRDGVDARAKGFRSLQDYAAARRAELEAAICQAGLDPDRILRRIDLGPGATPIADQESVWRLAELTLALTAELRSFRPEAILTHPYEGGHPDHDACAFAAHAAARLVGASCGIIEAPFYHAGGTGMETGRFLPGGPAEVIRTLSVEERIKKRKRLACFVSQIDTLRPFGVEDERFRWTPAYDFTQPPHPGKLFYENFSWGVTGAHFRAQAASALQQLKIENPDSLSGCKDA
ncbi:MAG TPA: PIG-L family deacetylase [Terracidiphilus sp.]|nr:PIG-L family deacetylase [Terracidiphilus sp.]